MSAADDAFEQRMCDAEAAKLAGNTALAAGNAKSASFHYKRVYLYLAEYLPASMATSTLGGSATPAPSPAPAGQAGEEPVDGLVGLLQRGRKQQQQQQRERERQGGGDPTTDAAAEAARRARLHTLYGSTLNNLTLVNYKLGRYRDGIATATCLLDKVPGFELNPKALLRRAYCYIGLQSFDEAERDVAELERVVGHAVARCGEGGGGAMGAEVVDGLGGMTTAAVAAMQGELPALREAVLRARQTTAAKEKRMFQKMFSA